MGSDSDRIATVKWDEFPTVGKDVTISGAPVSDLEVVTSIPHCGTPTVPGMYIVQRGVQEPELAIVRNEPNGLYVITGISCFYLNSKSGSIAWWGPLEIL